MRYIKLYEKNLDRPKRLDYVVIQLSEYVVNRHPQIQSFFNNNVGKILGLDENDAFIVRFSTAIPYQTPVKDKYVYCASTKNIIFHSPNKEEVENYLMAKKYNL